MSRPLSPPEIIVSHTWTRPFASVCSIDCGGEARNDSCARIRQPRSHGAVVSAPPERCPRPRSRLPPWFGLFIGPLIGLLDRGGGAASRGFKPRHRKRRGRGGSTSCHEPPVRELRRIFGANHSTTTPRGKQVNAAYHVFFDNCAYARWGDRLDTSANLLSGRTFRPISGGERKQCTGWLRGRSDHLFGGFRSNRLPVLYVLARSEAHQATTWRIRTDIKRFPFGLGVEWRESVYENTFL